MKSVTSSSASASAPVHATLKVPSGWITAPSRAASRAARPPPQHGDGAAAAIVSRGGEYLRARERAAFVRVITARWVSTFVRVGSGGK